MEFGAENREDRAQIALLYRLGRILRHVATDGKVTIEAEVPRRLLGRFRPAVHAS